MRFLCSTLSIAAVYAKLGGSTQGQRKLSVSNLSDDFSDATTLDQWDQSANSNQIESLEVSNGNLVLTPVTTSTYGFYGNVNGIAITKSIDPGVNFVMETSLVVSTNGGMSPPDADWCSAGLVLQLDGNDFAQVNLGRQGAAWGLPLTYGTQSMTTTSGSSTFDYLSSSDNTASLEGRLRICRVNNEVRLLRNMSVDAGWTVLAFSPNGVAGSIDRPDFESNTINAGIAMNRWSGASPTFQAVFDYVHFATPSEISDCEVNDLSTLGEPATPLPTPFPTLEPTPEPTGSPTEHPLTPPPTPVPTPEPTTLPTDHPITSSPTPLPTPEPTALPTELPTHSPITPSPVISPTFNAQNLSDEFTCPSADPCTVQDNGWTEHYPDRYDNAPVISNGELTIGPGVPFTANVWYMDSHGSMLSKTIPGGQDFVVETLVNTHLVNDVTEVPNGNWNVGGLIVRSVSDLGDWAVLNIGLQGPHGPMGLDTTLGVEAKSTVDDNSIFNYIEAPEGTTGETMSAALRICRSGSSFRFLFRFVSAAPEWLEIHPLNAPINPFNTEDLQRTDLEGDLEVGLMTNNMSFGSPNSDPFVANFQYVRFGHLPSMSDCGSIDLSPSALPTSSPVPPPTANPSQVPTPSPFITTASYNTDETISITSPTGTTYTCTAN